MNFDPGYVRCIETMLRAALSWCEDRGRDGLSFSLPDPEWMFIGALDEKTVPLLANNETSRQFLLALDAATNHEATMFQAAVVVRLLQLPWERWSEDAALLARARGAGHG